MKITPGTAPSASVALFDELARRGYDRHFDVPHRRAYDDLAWEIVASLLPDPPATVVDAGCGVGRWAARLVDLGHRVIGIEQAPEMAAAARARGLPGDHFTLVEGDLATVDHPSLPPRSGGADLVLAMGSVQYAADPVLALTRLAGWVAPNGAMAVLTDSLVALVLGLLAAGRVDEALERAGTGRGRWRSAAGQAELHLFDRSSLAEALVDAGLTDVVVRGLLVGSSGFGRDGLADRLEANPAAG
ncbi:MAG: class I SAM-dependent methyltransferase, partial [Acidimicrobiales bacterium]